MSSKLIPNRLHQEAGAGNGTVTFPFNATRVLITDITGGTLVAEITGDDLVVTGDAIVLVATEKLEIDVKANAVEITAGGGVSWRVIGTA